MNNKNPKIVITQLNKNCLDETGKSLTSYRFTYNDIITELIRSWNQSKNQAKEINEKDIENEQES